MLWNWNTIDSCFIASSWKITSKGKFAGSCIGVVLLVITLELLRRTVKEFDRYLINKHRVSGVAATVSPKSASGDGSPAPACVAAVNQGYRPTVFEQAIRALLHMLQFAVAYFVMLCVSLLSYATHVDSELIPDTALPCTTTDISSSASSSVLTSAASFSTGSPSGGEYSHCPQATSWVADRLTQITGPCRPALPIRPRYVADKPEGGVLVELQKGFFFQFGKSAEIKGGSLLAWIALYTAM